MLETLQASAPVGLGFVDREFRLVHLNEMLAAVNGSTVQDQIGKKVAEVVPDIWPQIESPLPAGLGERRGDTQHRGERARLAAEPGRKHYWLASYYPVHVDNEVIGIGIVAVDVTERRQADEFRSIALNQMAEGMFVTDDQGTLTYMNQAFTQMLGWTEAELKGEHLHDVIHTRHADGSTDPLGG